MKWTWCLVLAACTEAVDVEPLGDYTQWPEKYIVTGNVPGHGDTYRVIYANDIAHRHVPGPYEPGSIIVKEVYDHEGGTLDEIAVVRMVKEFPAAYNDEGGWLFTETHERDGEERYNERCWRLCHVAAPYRGLFLFYGSR